MTGSRIPNLNFRYGIEDVEPVSTKSERAVLPTGGTLQPTDGGTPSEVEELVRAPSFTTVIDEFIRPQISDLAICRPERFASLLAETREILDRGGSSDDAANAGLVDVLDRQDGLRDLLGYYVQSLLSA